MVSKPDQMPKWADLDQVDPVSQSNNVLTPPPVFQSFGWERLQFPPRNWFNWLGRYTYRWIAWLNQQEAQAVAVSAADSVASSPIFEVVNGGMALIFVVDTNNPAKFYEGITYIPPAYGGGTLSFTTSAFNLLAVSTIAADGSVTITGGVGPYIIYGQMKTI